MNPKCAQTVLLAEVTSVCVEDIELPIIELQVLLTPINEISCLKEVLILYGYIQGFTDTVCLYRVSQELDNLFPTLIL